MAKRMSSILGDKKLCKHDNSTSSTQSVKKKSSSKRERPPFHKFIFVGVYEEGVDRF